MEHNPGFFGFQERTNSQPGCFDWVLDVDLDSFITLVFGIIPKM
jgi:hypothetical protein